MVYDSDLDRWFQGQSDGLGRSGALVTPNDDADIPGDYARLRVFVPANLASAQIKIMPARQEDDVAITLPLPVGQASVLEYIVRRVFATDTTAGLVIHRID